MVTDRDRGRQWCPFLQAVSSSLTLSDDGHGRDVGLGVHTKIHSADGDTVLCLENNQKADGDTETRLENDDECSLKKQKHVTCLQKVNKQSSLGWKM